MDWYARFLMGLPPRPEDRADLRRIAPELFMPGHTRRPNGTQLIPDFEGWLWLQPLSEQVRRWLATETEEVRPRVTVREGSCPQHDCPLNLHTKPRRGSAGEPRSDEPFVIELMTVAGGWSAKAKAFFDMTRKVHGGKGDVKDLLITDPYIYFEHSEDGTAGGTASFLEYLENLNITPRSKLTIYQPPYAKGDKEKAGETWRTNVRQHADSKGFEVEFEFFHVLSSARFHDRFYLARHVDGTVSGMFGPSMTGLNDDSFALMGEIEDLTMKRLLSHLKNWN